MNIPAWKVFLLKTLKNLNLTRCDTIKGFKTCCLSLLVREACGYKQMRACAAWIVLILLGFCQQAVWQWALAFYSRLTAAYLPPGWLCTTAGGTKSWHCLIPALVSHLQDGHAGDVKRPLAGAHVELVLVYIADA